MAHSLEPSTETQPLAVTQYARKAAIAFRLSMLERVMSGDVTLGEDAADENPLVLAFARFEAETLARVQSEARQSPDGGRGNPRSFGFLPGNYMNVCIGCREQFEGAKRSIRCIKCAGDLAAVETERLTRELDITNADHIALWIEANTIPDEPMSQCASWLACRIVEAHESALSTPPADDVSRTNTDVLVEALRRISELTPAKAGANTALQLHWSAKAIADKALSVYGEG